MNHMQVIGFLEDVYQGTTRSLTLESDFSCFTHSYWSWRLEEQEQCLSGVSIPYGDLSVSALIGLLRLGHKVPKLRTVIKNHLSAESLQEFQRHELLILATTLLPSKARLALIAAEDPSGYDNVVCRDTWAAQEYFYTLKTKGSVDLAVVSRWRPSKEMQAMIDCLQDERLLGADASVFVSKLVEASSYLKDPKPPFLSPAYLLCGLEEFRRFASTPELDKAVKPVMTHMQHGAGSSEPVVLANTDKKYFEKYGERFLLSCGRCSDRPIVHLNLVNFSLSVDRISALEEQCGVRLNVSEERCAAKGRARAAFYSVSRYFHLSFWLDHYPFIAITDIDGQVIYDLDELSDVPKGKIALHEGKNSFGEQKTFIWKNFHAGRVVLREPEPELIRAIEQFIEQTFFRCLEEGRRIWFLDQVGLSLARLAYPDQWFCVAPELFHQKKKIS